MSDELYQQVILDHNKNPRNFHALENATHFADGHNPLCGDRFKVYLRVEKGRIEELSFEGSGCAISKASASLMTQHLKGKTIEEVEQDFDQFHRLLIRELDPQAESHQLGKLALFANVWKYPARVKCAGLSWHTVKSALDGGGVTSTE